MAHLMKGRSAKGIQKDILTDDNGALIVSGGGGPAASDLANGAATAPSSAPANGSQLALLASILAAQASANVAYGPDTAGTITTGGSHQQVLAAAAAPRDFLLTNDSTSDLRVMVGTGNPSATAGRRLYPGGSFTTRTAERVAIWGATTGQAFTYSVGVV